MPLRPEAPINPGSATLIGVLLLSTFFLVCLVQRLDFHRRASLELSEANTAVGDKIFCPEPSSTDIPVATFNGKAFLAKELKSSKLRDSQMRKSANDPATGLSLYTYENGWFLKTEENRFLKVRPKD